jgi:hypothetical protein
VAPPTPISSTAAVAQSRQLELYSAAPVQGFKQYVLHMQTLRRITHPFTGPPLSK